MYIVSLTNIFYILSTEQFEKLFHDDVKGYLLSLKEIDERLPETPDIDEQWAKAGRLFLADGMREFQNYPTVPFGWCMYMGMAIAKYWDEDWTLYSKVENLYVYLRDKRGFDNMDDYIREKVLLLPSEASNQLQNIVGECGSRCYNLYCHLHPEPSSTDAFYAFVAGLHVCYRMGAAMQLKRMGYRMVKVNG